MFVSMQRLKKYLLKAFEDCSVFSAQGGKHSCMKDRYIFFLLLIFFSNSIFNRFFCPLFYSSFSQTRSFQGSCCPYIVCPDVLVELLVCSIRPGKASSFGRTTLQKKMCLFVLMQFPVPLPSAALQTAQLRARKSWWEEMFSELLRGQHSNKAFAFEDSSARPMDFAGNLFYMCMECYRSFLDKI